MKNKIKFYALENAVKFGGKANPSAVIGKILGNNPELRKDMASLSKQIQQIVNEVNLMPHAEQIKAYNHYSPKSKPTEKPGLPELPNAVKGKVVTRIPPEPSKYNHIGHALSFIINYLYAQRYKGKCILRFEDTNPEKSKQEYVEAMLDDILKYLAIKPHKIIYVSDDLPKLYKEAEKLIQMGKAYVCHCSRDKMQKMRNDCTMCKCQGSLEEWNKMLAGKYDEGQTILRLRGNMKSLNTVMRDPVLFRINKAPHYRQKTKYCVWPLYDFENAVEDSINGVTHILRSSEFGSMRVELQNHIKDLLGLKKQEIVQYGRFNIKNSTTKGREIRELIQNGKVTGWDDPSLVTLKALKRRGILKETYYTLVEHVGLSPNTAKNIDWSLISAINRQKLDADVNRYFFVENPNKILVQNAPSLEPKLKLHPDHPKRGTRNFMTNNEFLISEQDLNTFKDGEIIRLMDCMNIKLEKGMFHFASLSYDEYKKSGSKIIHWLPADSSIVSTSVRMPNNEIKKGFSEAGIKKLKMGEIIQFARFGFCKLDLIVDDYQFWFTNR